MNDESVEIYLNLLINAGCKVKHRTELFDKEYVWLTDPQGVWFLERLPQEKQKFVSVGPLSTDGV